MIALNDRSDPIGEAKDSTQGDYRAAVKMRPSRTVMRLALLLCRLIVGFAFLTYGTVKLLGGQFHHGDFVIDSRNTEGTWLVWCFFGYSPVYARFIGLCELMPAILVLIPRTSTLGALALLAVSLNITVMDFCFAFPGVKYLALLLTVLCGVLVAGDYRRLKAIFWDNFSPDILEITPRSAPDQMPARNVVRWWWFVPPTICVALPFVNFTAIAVTPGPEEAARARCVAEGWDASAKRVVGWRKTQGDWGVNMEGYVDVVSASAGKPIALRVVVSRANGFVGWRAIGIERHP